MSGIGHNSPAADLIRAYVARVERLEEEIDGLNADKREVYSEAKGNGLCVKTLRALIRRRRKAKDAREEEDALLELYERAMEGRQSDPLDD